MVERLDPAPLIEHIQKLGLTHQDMKTIGLDSSHYKRMVDGKTPVTVNTADKVLTRTGSTLALIYPEFNVDALHERDERLGICQTCKKMSYFHDTGEIVKSPKWRPGRPGRKKWKCENCGAIRSTRRPTIRPERRQVTKEAVREYLAGGGTIAEIAAKYGVNRESLRERVAQEGLPRRPKGGSTTQIDATLVRTIGFEGVAKRANEMREEGATWPVIAKALGYSSPHQALKSAKRWREGKYSTQRKGKK